MINSYNSEGKKHGVWIKSMTYLHEDNFDNYFRGNNLIKMFQYEAIEYINGVKQGLYKKYSSNNNEINLYRIYESFYKDIDEVEGDLKPMDIGYYDNDLLQGEYKKYFKNGGILLEEYYDKGIREGIAKRYRYDGSLYSIEFYKSGEKSGYSIRKNYLCETEFFEETFYL